MENKNNESIENTENSTENIESTEYTESVETTENTENTENTEPAKGGHDLGTGSIGKLMLKMAIPTIIAQIINMLYNVVDRMYIGHIPDVGGIALTRSWRNISYNSYHNGIFSFGRNGRSTSRRYKHGSGR